MRSTGTLSGSGKAPRLSAAFACVALLFASLIAAGGSAPSASARPLEEVKDSGTLRVIVYTDFKPFSWEDENGGVEGINADLGRAIARELGVEAKIIARAPGEDIDDDIRSNIWQGPRTGGLKGDVMLHVPLERELIARNSEAALGNSYFYEEVVLALRTDVHQENGGLQDFEDGKGNKVAVPFGTSGHYLLMFTRDGKLKNNVSPYRDFNGAIEAFESGYASGVLARRARLQPLLAETSVPYRFVSVEFPGTLRGRWNVGTAVGEDSRDLGYAIGRVLRKLKGDGELQKIFAKHGVEFTPPQSIKYEEFERPGYNPLPLHLRK